MSPLKIQAFAVSVKVIIEFICNRACTYPQLPP
jgi:putative membrane protein